jgi:hypothetical protein
MIKKSELSSEDFYIKLNLVKLLFLQIARYRAKTISATVIYLQTNFTTLKKCLLTVQCFSFGMFLRARKSQTRNLQLYFPSGGLVLRNCTPENIN